MITIVVYFLFVLALSCSAALDYENEVFQLSCFNSKTLFIPSNGLFCNMVTWKTALAYNSSTASQPYTKYEPGSPLTVTEQDDYAQYLFVEAAGDVKITPHCKAVLKRYACVQVFPECIGNSRTASSSYFPPCKLLCDQLHAACPSEITSTLPSCSDYPTTSCTISSPNGYMPLDPPMSDYTFLLPLYYFVASLWFLIAFAWCVKLAIVSHDCLDISHAITCFPIMKFVVTLTAAVFWHTCNARLMCSTYNQLVFFNFQVIYETVEAYAFLMIANGTDARDAALYALRWRQTITFTVCFYIANSVLMSLELRKYQFWLGSAIIYGGMYATILFRSSVTFASYRLQTKGLDVGKYHGDQWRTFQSCCTSASSMCCYWFNYVARCNFSRNDAGVPQRPVAQLLETNDEDQANQYAKNTIIYRSDLYLMFLLLVLLKMGSEVYVHSLVDSEFWQMVTAYEMLDLAIMFVIMALFRPRKISPFFYAVPVTGNQGQEQDDERPLTTLVASDPFDDDVESDLLFSKDSKKNSVLELLPLVSRSYAASTSGTEAMYTTVPADVKTVVASKPKHDPLPKVAFTRTLDATFQVACKKGVLYRTTQSIPNGSSASDATNATAASSARRSSSSRRQQQQQSEGEFEMQLARAIQASQTEGNGNS